MAINDPDIELVRAVARGDKAAMRSLMERHGDRLMAVSYRMLGDQDAAEDVVQEAFIRLLKNAKKWEPGQALFSTWLHRVAINLCYDRLRKASSRYEFSAGDEVPDVADEQDDAAVRMEKSQQALALRGAMERLPERQKMALVLCHFEEMTNAEAAEIMEVSVPALESLLARARRSLKADMKLKEELSADMPEASCAV